MPKFRYIYCYNGSEKIGVATYSHDRELRTIFLESIFVELKYRDLGTGNYLLGRIKEIAKNRHAKLIILTVDRGFKDFSLFKWYKRYGFKSVKPFKQTRAMFYTV
jgi:GNAT superfamily N-acetyltransferase